MLFRTRYNVLFRQFRLLTAQAGSIPAAIRLIFEKCYKQSVSLIKPIPYKRGQYDYESRSKQLHDLRVNTIQAMLERYGKELLIDFAMKAEATEELATIIVQNIMKENYDFSLLIKMRDQNPRLCTDSLNRLYSFNGSEGLFSALKDSQLSDEEIGKRSIITHQGQKKKHLGQEVQKIR